MFNNNKKYMFDGIEDSMVYTRKLIIGNLLNLYFLVL